jgi:YD repeat-containing protein
VSTRTTPEGVTTFTYYLNKTRLQTVTDRSGSTRLDYNIDGHVTKKTVTIEGR